ncbi:hypothetical protein GQ54DRAFT_297257 [Martensiomyces pterosporus]|nr:hypothetical protein GQ54DRAFT_297257 [Martensiomyces pterosporus]
MASTITSSSEGGRSTLANNRDSALVDGEEMCEMLNRVHSWRLDTQCATLRPRQLRMLELGDILHRAGRLSANRLTNQDYTPPAIRRMESLQRVADELEEMTESDRRQQQRTLLSPLRDREMFLVSIAGKLGRVDGTTSLAVRRECLCTATSSDSSCYDEDDGACGRQRAVHPREHMRRFVQRSIERLHRLSQQNMGEQRFQRPVPVAATVVEHADMACRRYTISD